MYSLVSIKVITDLHRFNIKHICIHIQVQLKKLEYQLKVVLLWKFKS